MEYKVTVQQDESGVVYIVLPDELTDDLGWNEDTELVWNVNDEGKIGLRKREINDSSNKT